MAPTIQGPVLVTGGCGFLGHHIIRQLLETHSSKLTIASMDIVTTKHQIASPGVQYHTADISKRGEVQKVIDTVKPKVIFHTVSPTTYESDLSIFDRVNVQGTQNLIDAAKEVGTVTAFVFTSSSSVVHNQRTPMVQADESAPVLFKPNQPEYYSHTKAVAEKMVLDANRTKGSSGKEMLTVAMRPATMYGEGDNLMTKAMGKRALEGKANVQFGDGHWLYVHCYIENSVYAHLLAAEAILEAAEREPLPVDSPKRIEGEAFFVTDEEQTPFWQLQRIASEILGKPIADKDVKKIPRWFMMGAAFVAELVYKLLGKAKKPQFNLYVVRITTMERTFRINKIKERLGYRPLFGFREGYEKGIRWAAEDLRAEGELKKE